MHAAHNHTTTRYESQYEGSAAKTQQEPKINRWKARFVHVDVFGFLLLNGFLQLHHLGLGLCARHGTVMRTMIVSPWKLGKRMIGYGLTALIFSASIVPNSKKCTSGVGLISCYMYYIRQQ